ncbi:YjcZ family sporulation protein [Bacillus sp. F19]|nr:YjcZ family sporulation protein [Bacillus sp. F19]
MYGYDCGCSYPSYPVHSGGCGSSFVLIVVLFILLIIVGSTFMY